MICIACMVRLALHESNWRYPQVKVVSSALPVLAITSSCTWMRLTDTASENARADLHIRVCGEWVPENAVDVGGDF